MFLYQKSKKYCKNFEIYIYYYIFAALLDI